MTDTRAVVRRIICAAGVAATIAGAGALAAVIETPAPQPVAQVDCVANPLDPQCSGTGNMPQTGGDMGGPMGLPGAPNLETGGGVDQQQHSGSHH